MSISVENGTELDYLDTLYLPYLLQFSTKPNETEQGLNSRGGNSPFRRTFLLSYFAATKPSPMGQLYLTTS